MGGVSGEDAPAGHLMQNQTNSVVKPICLGLFGAPVVPLPPGLSAGPSESMCWMGLGWFGTSGQIMLLWHATTARAERTQPG